MTGLDTNAVVQAAVEAHVKHAATTAILRSEPGADHTLAVTHAVVGEFLQIVTDARRFDPA